MAAVCSQIPPPQTHIMNSMASTLRLFNCRSCFYRQFVSFFSGQSTCSVEEPRRRGASVVLGKALKAADTAVLKENWLDSLSCPSPPKRHLTDSGRGDPTRESSGSEWVIGIDPDLSGALAVLTTDKSGCTAQVFDSPHLQVLVSRRIRKRLDAKSIIHLLRSIDAPSGTTAYLEQSTPYPKDGKQGWWSGGFGYGMWIGILVASGFSVVPVSSMMWKNEFNLAGGTSTKDDSRRLASELFPSLGSQLSRKKDHGRAEALLIAAYGKGMKTSNPPIPSPHVTEELIC